MRPDTLQILRCPYCGGRLEVDPAWPSVQDGDEIREAFLACHCCTFPVVDGIPVMHLQEAAGAASTHLRDGRGDLARRALLGLNSEEAAARFDAVVSSAAATFREAMAALELDLEGGYFIYRFSDPSYVVAHALVRAVAATVLAGGGRALDVCGGSGHLTRAMMDLSQPPPVLADLFFGKIWLARRFTAPGCEAVCCDANAPLPFARGAFRFAMCADAFMFIWMKRLLAGELLRAVDPAGAVIISHAHNQRVWSPSHGQPLTADGYRDLFETVEVRLFAEAGLLADVVAGGPLDLARRDPSAQLDADPALTMIASRDARVFRPHPLDPAPGAPGELRVNPLYVAEPDRDRVRLRLAFPSVHYEEEFSACRDYLPEAVDVAKKDLEACAAGRVPDGLADLARRRVILDLPKQYC